jgi:PTH2 family peptidyl-tRNA hydrolase
MWKQVVIVRLDLKLSKGKLAAQAAHASMEAFKCAPFESQTEWGARGSKKVVLKVKDLGELIGIQRQARKERLPYALVRDAGRTEVEPGTVTALGIGPCESGRIDRITGHLKML